MSHSPDSTLGSKRKIAIIGFEGVQALDMIGPMEVFGKANEHLHTQDNCYEIILASPDGGHVHSSAGLLIANTIAVANLPADLDTIVVAGGTEAGLRKAALETRLLPWLQKRLESTGRIASVCTGAFILAAAGLLDGKRATTHWASCALLQEMWPVIQVDADAIFTTDHPIYTSAGVSTGIDLCLALIEADVGSAIALAVARDLVLFMRRPGSQAQFSPMLKAQTFASSVFSKLLAGIAADPCADLSVPALAERAGMCERTFVRRFRNETGTSPAQFVKRVRLDNAKVLLETSELSLARIADRSGFNSMDSLHRLFIKHLGVTPAAYRQRFGRASS
ncbi:MAG: DJ-1/PfpI family protein [Pseudohongiella sp.]|nr:DJ-1/PfpI family protein [Pseudohongiella sp.]